MNMLPTKVLKEKHLLKHDMEGSLR